MDHVAGGWVDPQLPGTPLGRRRHPTGRTVVNTAQVVAALALAVTVGGGTADAQTFPTDDPVLRRIWGMGMDSSRTYDFAQVLMDSIGPRLTGTPELEAAGEWLVSQYASWGVPARTEQYGTWRGWRRGPTHVDLIRPRVRTLEATMLAWSPGTEGPVEGEVVALPMVGRPDEFAAWLYTARGKFVLISPPQASCRPDESWERFADPSVYTSMLETRDRTMRDWQTRMERTGYTARTLPQALEQGGVAGVLTSTWSGGWGVTRIFGTRTESVPSLDLSCEDYGLLFRLAEHSQGPFLRVDARGELLGEVPALNTIAELRGVSLPDEYVVLSAHLDSWDGGSGATDTGAGTVALLEAMRILKEVYPEPKRTILVGHWGGEEQGLNGSRAFAEDNPHVVQGLHVLLNFDIGTGLVNDISMQGMMGAGAHFSSWFAQMPSELSEPLKLTLPGTPHSGGTDHASFLCYGVPAFRFGGREWDYFTYTWHTNRDTFDKLVFEEVRHNATLIAAMTYLAAEDPQRVSRDRRDDFPSDPETGEVMTWPDCREAERAYPGVGR